MAQKSDLIWLDGKFVKWGEAKVHVLTHSLHYGSGVFEGLRCYDTPKGPAIFRLRDHMHRLTESARIHQVNIPYEVQVLEKAVVDVVRRNRLKECYIRPIVFYGHGEMHLSPLSCPVQAAIAAFPFGPYLGKEGIEKGVRCKISSWVRIHSNVLPPQAKCCGNYANSILAHREALDCGFNEAIMVDSRGNISEGPGENIFMVRDNTLFTPPVELDILRGITRHTIIHLAQDMGIRTIERHIPSDEIYVADEAFFTGTAAEVTPIREVDARMVGDGRRGPITARLQAAYWELVKGKNRKYPHWLTLVKQ